MDLHKVLDDAPNDLHSALVAAHSAVNLAIHICSKSTDPKAFEQLRKTAQVLELWVDKTSTYQLRAIPNEEVIVPVELFDDWPDPHYDDYYDGASDVYEGY